MSVKSNSLTGVIVAGVMTLGLAVNSMTAPNAIGRKHFKESDCSYLYNLNRKKEIAVDSGDTYTTLVTLDHKGKKYLFSDSIVCRERGAYLTKSTFHKDTIIQKVKK